MPMKADNKDKNLLNGKPMPCKLDALHFICLALHVAIATLPLQESQLPAQSGPAKVAEHPAVSIL
jgi:hypothetical protein